MPRPLAGKQARFIEELRLDGDPVAAARRAGYADSVAVRVQHTLLAKSHVRREAEAVLAEVAARPVEEPADQASIEPPQDEPVPSIEDRILAEWSRIAFAPTVELSPPTVDAIRNGHAGYVKMRDKLNALDKLGRHYGLLTGDDAGARDHVEMPLEQRLAAYQREDRIAEAQNVVPMKRAGSG